MEKQRGRTGPKPKFKEPLKQLHLTVPQSAIDGLDVLAENLGLRSRSELVARVGLGELSIGELLGEFSAN